MNVDLPEYRSAPQSVLTVTRDPETGLSTINWPDGERPLNVLVSAELIARCTNTGTSRDADSRG